MARFLLAQSTVDQGTAAASLAQSSRAQAQDSADQASLDAQAAGVLGIADAAAVAMVNQRVSDLDDYKNEFEVDVFFARDSAVLYETAKERLRQSRGARMTSCVRLYDNCTLTLRIGDFLVLSVL